jgi:hypothetical protein
MRNAAALRKFLFNDLCEILGIDNTRKRCHRRLAFLGPRALVCGIPLMTSDQIRCDVMIANTESLGRDRAPSLSRIEGTFAGGITTLRPEQSFAKCTTSDAIAVRLCGSRDGHWSARIGASVATGDPPGPGSDGLPLIQAIEALVFVLARGRDSDSSSRDDRQEQITIGVP